MKRCELKMSINAKHLYDLVITQALDELAEAREVMNSRVAKKLVLATACHESACATYLRQFDSNNNYTVARGIFQIEPATHDWIFTQISREKFADIRDVVFNKIDAVFENDRLVYDLKYAAKICRLRYYLVPAALPDDNLFSIANYWGKYYQTDDQDLNRIGAKEKLFIENCKKYAANYFN